MRIWTGCKEALTHRTGRISQNNGLREYRLKIAGFRDNASVWPAGKVLVVVYVVRSTLVSLCLWCASRKGVPKRASSKDVLVPVRCPLFCTVRQEPLRLMRQGASFKHGRIEMVRKLSPLLEKEQICNVRKEVHYY
jgi:hypothetical protein